VAAIGRAVRRDLGAGRRPGDVAPGRWAVSSVRGVGGVVRWTRGL